MPLITPRIKLPTHHLSLPDSNIRVEVKKKTPQGVDVSDILDETSVRMCVCPPRGRRGI